MIPSRDDHMAAGKLNHVASNATLIEAAESTDLDIQVVESMSLGETSQASHATRRRKDTLQRRDTLERR